MWETKFLPPGRRVSRKIYPGVGGGTPGFIYSKKVKEMEWTRIPRGHSKRMSGGEVRRLGGHAQHGFESPHGDAKSGRSGILMVTQGSEKLRHDGICPESHHNLWLRTEAVPCLVCDGQVAASVGDLSGRADRLKLVPRGD